MVGATRNWEVKKKDEENSYEGLGLDGLLKEKDRAERNFTRSYKTLIGFIKGFEGDFMPEEDRKFSNYNRYRNQMEAISDCLPLDLKIDFFVYNKMNEEVIKELAKVNSSYIKRERDAIRNEWSDEELLYRAGVSSEPWLPPEVRVVADRRNGDYS